MKRFIAIAMLLLVPALASAQLPERYEAIGNPNVVAGADYLKDDPGPDLNRVHFFLTANVAGIKIPDFIPSTSCYAGGIGIDLRTVDQAFGEIQGVGMSVPILTCYPSNGQFLIQAGYSKGFTGEDPKDGYYAGVGFSLTSSTTMAAKREAKAKKKSAELMLSHPTPVS